MSDRVYNTTDGPLLVDRAGRIVGAREHRDDVDTDAAPAKAHKDAGRLIVVEDAPKTKAPRGRTTPEEG